jgi:hypothetical protein
MAKKQHKSKAIAFTFRSFLVTLLIFHKWPKTATTKQLLSFLQKAQKINC